MHRTDEYYTKKLSAEHLKLCYELAPPRIQQYLDAEINFALRNITPGDSVLELGCGYGRVLLSLVQKADRITGIDISMDSLHLAHELTKSHKNCNLLRMNAAQLAFSDQMFDVVVCIQNGISAFHVNLKDLLKESIRVTKPKGIILFSSYSEKIWDSRLLWFQLQSKAGFIGEIDYTRTGNGVIVCKDGFTATTFSKTQFRSLTKHFHVKTRFVEVDESSLFCKITHQ